MVLENGLRLQRDTVPANRALDCRYFISRARFDMKFEVQKIVHFVAVAIMASDVFRNDVFEQFLLAEGAEIADIANRLLQVRGIRVVYLAVLHQDVFVGRFDVTVFASRERPVVFQNVFENILATFLGGKKVGQPMLYSTGVRGRGQIQTFLEQVIHALIHRVKVNGAYRAAHANRNFGQVYFEARFFGNTDVAVGQEHVSAIR